MTAPGWYQAEGDPPGTTRYWNGESWVGDYVVTPTAPASYGGSPGSSGPHNLASPWARIGARLIDLIVVLVLAAVVFGSAIAGVIEDIDALGPFATDSQVERVINDAVEDNAGLLFVFSGVVLVWDAVWVGLFGGTPGKLMLGMRVARADRGTTPPGWGKAILRSLNRLISLIPFVGGLVSILIGLVSLIMLFTDIQRRTVMDRVAGTVVIRK